MESAIYISDLAHLFLSKQNCSIKSLIVLACGVANFEGKSSFWILPIGCKALVATSIFAAYPEISHIAHVSSPNEDSTINSCESLPPIEPEEAPTTKNFNPDFLYISLYASACLS